MGMILFSRRVRRFRLYVVKKYLINYFAFYARRTLSRLRVKLVSPSYLVLRII